MQNWKKTMQFYEIFSIYFENYIFLKMLNNFLYKNINISVSLVLQEVRIKTCKEKFGEVEKVVAADCYTQ